MLIATFNFHPSPYVYFIKGKSVFQDRATQDAPNSDRVATKPYLRQFWGSALTASRASVATLAIFASRRAAKTLVGEPPQTRLWDSSAQTPLCYFGTKCPKIRPLRCASSPHKVLRLCGVPHAQSNLSASPCAIAPVPFCAGRP